MYYQPILLSALATIGSVTALAIPPGQQSQQGQPGQQQRQSTPTVPDTRVGTPQFLHVPIQIPSPNYATDHPSNIGPHESATTPNPQLTVPMGGQDKNGGDTDKHVRRVEQPTPDVVGSAIVRAMIEKEKQIKEQQQHGHERRGEDVDADEQDGEEEDDGEEPDSE